jgi:hypothetical protein
MTLKKNKKILEIEEGSTILHSVENSIRMRLWAHSKTDHIMNK